MTLPKRDRSWNGWVVWLLAAGAGLGLLNSVLQLCRYSADLGTPFSSGEWVMIGIWASLLAIWALILGIISGVALGRRWYGSSGDVADGISPVSMASSD